MAHPDAGQSPEFLPKPSGGERPIALLATLYRVWARCRGPWIREWDVARASFYDRALAGSSALQAAMGRLLVDEVATLQGLQSCRILWDIEKFYDSVSWLQLLHWGQILSYPPELLYLGVIVHMSPRVLRHDGHHSDLTLPGNSILAGCTQANSFGRIVVYDVLEQINMANPCATLESYVDDLNQGATGSSEDVARHLVKAAVHLHHALSQKDLRISSKSIIVSSSLPLARNVQSQLCRLGISVELDAQA